MPANKIPVSGTKDRETGPSGIKTEDLIDYKKFPQMMVTSLKATSLKLQGPSHKLQALWIFTPNARFKLQAPSNKLFYPRTTVQVPSKMF